MVHIRRQIYPFEEIQMQWNRIVSELYIGKFTYEHKMIPLQSFSSAHYFFVQVYLKKIFPKN